LIEALESGARPKGGVLSIQNGCPSIGAEHISAEGTLKLDNIRYVPEEFYSLQNKGKVMPGDILVVKDGATTGRIAFFSNDVGIKEALLNEHVFLLRPQKTIDGEFLYYGLRSPWGQRLIRKCFHGAAQGGITKNFVKSVWLPVPGTIEEQRRVASDLSLRMSEAMKLKKAAERVVDATIALRYSVVAREMEKSPSPVGFLSDVLSEPPKSGWAKAYGNNSSQQGTLCLTVSSVLGFEFNSSQISYTLADVDEYADYWARSGDIFMTRSNTPELVGHAAIYQGVPERVIFPDLLIRLRVNQELASTKFVYYWLMAPITRKYIIRNARGSSGTMKKVTLKMIRDLPFPSSLNKEQQLAIVTRIERHLRPIKALYQSSRRQAEAANAMSEVFLNQVFGGFEPPMNME
jgi:type I restriction enzyme S subunit